MKSNILLLLIATDEYWKFVEPLIESAEKYFLTEHNVDFLVFTDKPSKIINKENVYTSVLYHTSWPYPTLKRYHTFISQKEFILKYDYTFYLDVDMRIENKVGDEILSDGIVATIHAGYCESEPKRCPYERNSVSTAYMSGQDGKHYYAGGFNGGRTQDFVDMSETIIQYVDKDLSSGIIPVWHDESYLNKYLWVNEPSKKLDPSYCYPEELRIPFERKIVAINKINHGMANSITRLN